MQASWKIRPTWAMVKVLPGGFKPWTVLAFSCTACFTKGWVSCSWVHQLLLIGDKVRGTQGTAQVNLKDSIPYDRKQHHPPLAPHFPTSAGINDTSFAEMHYLGCSGTLLDSIFILTPPLPANPYTVCKFRGRIQGEKCNMFFKWLAPYIVFSLYEIYATLLLLVWNKYETKSPFLSCWVYDNKE